MASARKIKLTDSKKRKIDPKKIEEALGAEFIGKVNDPQDGLNLYNERRKYIFLQDIIKKAAEVRHADQACNLVYFINNYVNALEPALSVSSAFDAVVTDLQDKIQQLQSINEAIQLKTEELEALHDKDAVLSTTADLLAKHEETKKRIAEELDELQKNYAFKRAELEKVFNESRLEAEKQRKREAEDHQYNLALARKKEQDAYDEKVRLRDQADRAKEEALTKNWQLREEALAAREAEYNKQKAENETFQQRVDAQVAKDVAIVGNKMKADHNVQINQMTMSFDAEKKVLGMEISHLKATVETQQKAIDSLNAQLKESREQQNALALKAMEVDSGKAALDAVKDFAANSSPSKK